MKIAVFSDSHSSIARMAEAIKKNHFDVIIHLGDYVRDAQKLSLMFPELKIFKVRGNNDIFADEADTLVEQISGLTFFMTHGHKYSYTYPTNKIYQEALDSNADIALFGHTHTAYVERRGNILILNPGSISMPRHGRASWACITIDGSKDIRSEIIEV
ncbi:MAG: metallophosphoesterase [Clostridiales bacterium]|nr:metallophosphoesterase [Clostridiales bacterium]